MHRSFFLLQWTKRLGRSQAFLNGLATDEEAFRDEFFTDITVHNPEGKNIFLLGLDVRPEYRRQGLAREIMNQYVKREQANGRKMLKLTCLEQKVEMYKKKWATKTKVSLLLYGAMKNGMR